QGTTNYIPTKTIVQAGAIQWTGSAATGGSVTVTFPREFASSPLVFVNCTVGPNPPTPPNVVASGQSVDENSMDINWISTNGATTFETLDFNWIAFGPAI